MLSKMIFSFVAMSSFIQQWLMPICTYHQNVSVGLNAIAPAGE